MFVVRDATVISGLREQLSATVSALDLGCCLPSAAVELVQEGDRIERLGRAIKTLAAAKVAQSPAWQTGGARSPEDWLAEVTGTSKTDAADTITTGQRLEELPATEKAVRAGKLSSQQAKAVTDAASADPSAEGGC